MNKSLLSGRFSRVNWLENMIMLLTKHHISVNQWVNERFLKSRFIYVGFYCTPESVNYTRNLFVQNTNNNWFCSIMAETLVFTNFHIFEALIILDNIKRKNFYLIIFCISLKWHTLKYQQWLFLQHNGRNGLVFHISYFWNVLWYTLF